MPVPFLDFYNSLDPDPLKRGKQFEHFAKWFLKADPEWATQVDQIWLWAANLSPPRSVCSKPSRITTSSASSATTVASIVPKPSPPKSKNTLAWISDENRPSGTLRTGFVSSNMPAIKRKTKLDQLKALGADERGVLSNARCLSEGVDVCTCCTMYNATSSRCR